MPAYTIQEHRHRFAVWAAGRACSRGKGKGFTVKNARTMLEAAGLKKINSADDLPGPEEIDRWVNVLIRAVMKAGVKQCGLDISYGRAQKLVNIYLKSKIVCGVSRHDDRIKKLHPPLDSELLNNLHKGADRLKPGQRKQFLKKLDTARSKGRSWTGFNKPTYDAYIRAIKILQQGRPLWEVEECWMPSELS
jgi:hypothetical protein